MQSWQASAIQNSHLATGDSASAWDGFHNPRSGKTFPGPIRFGAVALATSTDVDPMICAMQSVAETCIRLRVCRRIIPKPTPCTASSTPNQSHNEADTNRAEMVWGHLSRIIQKLLEKGTHCSNMDQRGPPTEHRVPHCWFPTAFDTIAARPSLRQISAAAKCVVWKLCSGST